MVSAPSWLPWNLQERFEAFLTSVKRDAKALGVSEATLSACMDDLEMPTSTSESVVKDRTSAERVETWIEYLARRASDDRADAATDALRRMEPQASAIASHFGVPLSVLGALWSVESSCGRFCGSHDAMKSLSALAFVAGSDPRRADYFRREMVAAMQLLERVGGPDKRSARGVWLRGSYAGALGQCQFMPSNVLECAVDWDGDGRADVWSSESDALASIAQFLVKRGWDAQQTWSMAYPVTFPNGKKQDPTPKMASMTAWKILGAEDRCLEELGKAWRSPPEGATLRLVGPAEDVQFLVGRNFDVLMRYNPSQKYAATVSVLSDKIQRRLEEDFNGGPAPDEACPSVPQPKPERPE